MKLIDGHWVDEHNNKWVARLTSEEMAVHFSYSLKGCARCSDKKEIWLKDL